MSGDRDLFESDDQAREARARHQIGNPFADAGAQAQRRGRGRPSGALNLKTKDFERYYSAMGYRDPLKAMAEWLTADAVALQAWFEEHEQTRVAIGKGTAQAVPSLLEIIKEQHAVAVALAPYLHGKKPVQVEIIDERLPTLIVDLGTNQLADARRLAEQRALSVGSPIEGDAERAWQGDTKENNDLAEGE
ncbi:hypothetical protein EN817_17600 [Mesorhizobium sp. M3A.F.Ca.ET.174.01.1.1]|uniref:hypothetical protein n=1 Tax=unclassified Mesorhizobium TaxID=325217 RepID=UPI001093972D|nr:MULTISPECIES: hypothetical protein [unclassified Mesorhizobium]TGS86717.1 hypothetical protein EN818_15455 [Mesorhizobium sp. M3A.F.Ca.ET.175.01.1.1]TGT25165.1 hypothetical protein EN817_17600 [Mesorhizobium sp. M3A.F.Ca.ET.174.01.1.1]